MKEIIQEGMECMAFNNPIEEINDVEITDSQTIKVIVCKLSGTKLLNVRATPDGEIIGTLATDDVFGMISSTNEVATEWVRIRSKKGLSGWVMSRYIAPGWPEEWSMT